jgi:hypothetical protein
MDFDDLPPDQAIHMTGEPMQVVFEWLRAVFDGSDLAAAWPLTDGPLRLALAQSWILMHEDLPEVGREEREGLAAALSAAGQPRHSMWPSFAGWRIVRWREVLPDWVTHADQRGFYSEPSLIGPDLEAIIVTPNARGYQYEPDTQIVVQRFLVRHTPEGVRLAGIGGVLPIPGWPPTETGRLPT